jgi:3'(2'), 5'-bisphosphate nucleotidase
LSAPRWDLAALRQLAAIAEAAGAAVLHIYQGAERPRVAAKADATPLTEADLAADACIRAHLGEAFAGPPLVSEERAERLPDAARAAGYFLVDPLDGTREFLARNGEFTVNIAWVEGSRAVLGVVHAPALCETFFGAAGLGAWRRDAAGERPIAVRAAPAVPLRILTSRSHGNAAQARFLAGVPLPSVAVAAGSSLKFCRIAEGAADLYPRLSPTMAWDTAAGQGVLQAAGGIVWGAPGEPLPVPADPHAAPNPHFVAAGSAALAELAWSWIKP